MRQKGVEIFLPLKQRGKLKDKRSDIKKKKKRSDMSELGLCAC